MLSFVPASTLTASSILHSHFLRPLAVLFLAWIRRPFSGLAVNFLDLCLVLIELLLVFFVSAVCVLVLLLGLHHSSLVFRLVLFVLFVPPCLEPNTITADTTTRRLVQTTTTRDDRTPRHATRHATRLHGQGDLTARHTIMHDRRHDDDQQPRPSNQDLSLQYSPLL